MSTHVYFPSDLLGQCRVGKRTRDAAACWYLLGFRSQGVYVVVQLTRKPNPVPANSCELLRGFGIVGTINMATPSPLRLSKHLLHLEYTGTCRYPTIVHASGVSAVQSTTFVLFQPPKFKNLEYLSINPIALQSGRIVDQTTIDPAVKSTNRKFNQLASPTPTITSNIGPFNNEILDKINQCLQIRTAHAKLALASPFVRSSNRRFQPSQLIMKPLILMVGLVQTACIWMIKLLNVEWYRDKNGRGVKLTAYSAVLRQLELRLQQLNYFPIQFLCYFDRSILYHEFPSGTRKGTGTPNDTEVDTEFSRVLDLPIFNSNLNINNSNYINFYNSVWLIINDILIGFTIQKLIVDNYGDIAHYVNEVAIKKILFDDLFNLISWVSFEHPAGFKLNNELGLFVGDLFLWTLRFWKLLCVDVFTISETGGSGGWYIGGGSVGEILSEVGFTGGFSGFRVFSGLLFYKNGANPLFKTFISLLCYMGYSFLVSFLIDYLQIISFHIYCFYFASANIYKKQLLVLKSLFQLFCGKKYNVLRNRIDNLDNYSSSLDLYEVDQLLLGTLFFVILTLLLPTTFAFYLTFFLTRMFCLAIISIAESMLVLLNYFPLFVMLLKLKNSKRLQGGLDFRVLDTVVANNKESIVYMRLFNKSLTYNEIFKNFMELFKSKSFEVFSIVPNFVNGVPVKLVQETKLKFMYLMLPGNYDQTVILMNHILWNTEQQQQTMKKKTNKSATK